jgi:spore germination protein
MEIKEEITHGQTACLTYASAAGNIVYTFTFITNVSGRSFWVAVLIGVLLNIPLAAWILYLSKHMQGGTIFDILQMGLGKIISKFIIIIYVFINIAVAACMLNLITGAVKVFFLPHTPSLVITSVIVLLCAIFANSGIQTFGKLIQILSVLFTLNYFMGFSLSFYKTFKIEYVFPVFDTSLLQFTKGIIITAGTISECLLFLMAAISSVPQTKKQNLSVYKGLAVWSLVLSFAIIIMEGDIGNELLAYVGQAGIAVARVLEIKTFIRGVEILLLMTYQYIAIEKTIIYIYICQVSLKKLFNVNKGRFLLIIAALLILAAAVYINSLNIGYYLAVFLGSYVILPFIVIVLLLASLSIAIGTGKSEGAK